MHPLVGHVDDTGLLVFWSCVPHGLYDTQRGMQIHLHVFVPMRRLRLESIEAVFQEQRRIVDDALGKAHVRNDAVDERVRLIAQKITEERLDVVAARFDACNEARQFIVGLGAMQGKTPLRRKMLSDGCADTPRRTSDEH